MNYRLLCLSSIASVVLFSAAHATALSPEANASAGAASSSNSSAGAYQTQTQMLNNMSLQRAQAMSASSGGDAAGGYGSASSSSGTGNTNFDAGDTTAWGVSFAPPPFSPSAGPANAWGITETDAVGFPLIGGGYQDQRINYAPEALREMAGLVIKAWDDDAEGVATRAVLCRLVPQFADAAKLTRFDCDE